MAVDTRSKRASVVSLLVGFSVLAPVLPDATLDAGDRQHAAWAYSGIAATAPVTSPERNYVLHKDDTVDEGRRWDAIGPTTATDFDAGGVFFGGTGGTVFAQDSANLFWDDANDRLGIGTNAPTVKLHLVVPLAGFPAAVIKAESPGAGAALQLSKAASGNDASVQFQIAGTNKWKIGSFGSAPHSFGTGFGVWENVGATFALGITSARDVGIGTIAPGSKLEVVGTVQSTGLKMTTSPGAGKVLTSDAAGVGTWETGPGYAWAGNSDNVTVANGATVYGPASGSMVMNATDSSAGTRNVVPRAGTVGNLRVIASASHVAGDNVYTVMLNGVATTVTCTLTGAGTTGNDTVNSFAVVAGDEIGMRLATSSDGFAAEVKHSWSLTISD